MNVLVRLLIVYCMLCDSYVYTFQGQLTFLEMHLNIFFSVHLNCIIHRYSHKHIHISTCAQTFSAVEFYFPPQPIHVTLSVERFLTASIKAFSIFVFNTKWNAVPKSGNSSSNWKHIKVCYVLTIIICATPWWSSKLSNNDNN